MADRAAAFAGGSASSADRRRRVVEAANYATAVQSLAAESRLDEDDAALLARDADAEVAAAVAGVLAAVLTPEQRRERRDAREG